MARYTFSNKGATTLTSSITTGQTSIVVVDSTSLPNLAAGQRFYLVLETVNRSNFEVCEVTAIDKGTHTLTVTRGVGGTVAAFAAGSYAENRLTRNTLLEYIQRSGDTIDGDLTVTGATTLNGAVTVNGTVDDRDIALDGAKLDNIETDAKDDQTGPEIKGLYEAELNAFTDTLFTKLNDINITAINDSELATAASADAAALSEANAQNSASNAGTSETNAGNSASAAGTSESNSNLQRTYAQEWAQQLENTAVSVVAGGDNTTTFSSLHHAAKAADSAASIVGDAAAASTSASNAGTSETNAGTSAGEASTSADEAAASAALINPTSANIVNRVVARDASGDFAARIITTQAVLEAATVVAAANIDLATGAAFTRTLSANITFTASNVPASGLVGSFVLELVNGGNYAVTWIAGTTWDTATAPVLTAGGLDILGFYTIDAGTTWRGVVLAQAVA
jgi:hypothetical protein